MNKNDIKNLINTSSPVIFEIGAADGIDTLEFIEVFSKDMTLYCFEPDPRNCKTFLEGGFRECAPHLSQGINKPNVIFENKAISDTNGIIQFNQSNTIYSSSIKVPTEELSKEWPHITFKNTFSAESVTLDSYVEQKNINIIDFIWCDVQGAEDLVIKGGKETFKNKVRFFYTEYANKQYYKNSPNQFDIKSMLGDNFIIIKDFGTDVLLKNTLL